MSDRERIEKAAAERGARAAFVNRTSRGPTSRAIQAALAKYLAAEAYREEEQPEVGRRTRRGRSRHV